MKHDRFRRVPSPSILRSTTRRRASSVLAAVVVTALCCSPASAGLKFVGARFAASPISLSDVSGIAVSPDGKNLYATSSATNAVVVFTRDPVSGKLVYLEQKQDGVDGVDGLGSAYGVDVSADGKNVYVAGKSDSALAVFSRDTTTGALTFVEVQKNGVNGVDGLGGARGVGVSADGTNVYVTGYNDSALAVFSRNTTTGALTFVERQKDGVNGVDGLGGASGVGVSADGKNVYVAGYSDSAVAIFSRNATTGALTFVKVQKDGVGGVDGLGGARGVGVSADGKNVYVAGASDSAVAVFSRNATTGALSFLEMQKQGVGGVAGLSNPMGLRASADGHHVYVASNDGVGVFARNLATGALTFVENPTSNELLGGSAVALSPDGLYVYFGNYSEIFALRRNPATGGLRYSSAQADTGTASSLAGASGVAVGVPVPSFPFDLVHVSAHDANALVTFGPGDTTGLLFSGFSMVDGVNGVHGLGGAEAVATSPDGQFVFVAAAQDFALSNFYLGASELGVQFDSDPGVDGLYEARSVAVSPDGAHVYVVGRADAAVAVFGNAGFGPPTFIEVQKQGVSGVDGLNLPSNLVISPDGAHVYVTSYEEASVAVFSRNAVTGQLTFTQVLKNGVDGVTGMLQAYHLAISPDGAHVYVTSINNPTKIVLFSRNPVTGALTFVAAQDFGSNLLAAGGAITVSPDGSYVYVAGFDNEAGASALITYRRDPATGLLTLQTWATDGLDGVDGLGGASSVAVSGDGAHVYVTGSTDNAVAIFAQSCGDGILDPGEECDDGNLTNGDCCSSTCTFEAATCSEILGKSLIIKDPKPDVDPTKRSVVVDAVDTGSPDVVVGDPVTSGATLEVAANGTGSTRETFTLPAGATFWKALSPSGFKYSDSAGANGPVRLVLIKKASSGTFTIKAKLKGALTPLGVVPPNQGTDGGLRLSLTGGRSYCVRIGGPAGGTISASGNTAKVFKVKGPWGRAACP